MTAAKYGAGATVVSSIGASQFGRIKFPGSDTYYNIWGTDNVLARTVLQAIARQRIDVKGNITRLGDKTPQGYLTSAKTALTQYLRSGEDPVVGLLTDLAAGETYIGEKLHWDVESAWKLVRDRLPMVSQDMMDVAQTDGPLQTILSAPGAATGVTGITSYEPTRETFRAIPEFSGGITANEIRDIRDFWRHVEEVR